MSRLTCWIEKTYKPKVLNAKNTNSIYYYFFGGGFSIRISDHVFTEDKACDLNIICPENDRKHYIIMLKGYRSMINFDYTRTKIFIEDSLTVWKIKQACSEVKILTKAKKTEVKKDKVRLCNAPDRTSEENWQNIVDTYIIKDVIKWKELVKTQRRECKTLFANHNNIPYDTCVKILNKILEAKIIDVNIIRNGITKYLMDKYPYDYRIIPYQRQTLLFG